jgi:hypothetical protein
MGGAVAVDVVELLLVAVSVVLVAEELEPPAEAVAALAALLAAVTAGVAATVAAIEALSAPKPITLAATDASFSRARRRLAAATLFARSSVISLSCIKFLLLVKPGW